MSSIAPSLPSKPRALIPPWLKGKWGFLGIVFIVYILLNLAWTYFHWGGPQHVTLISDLFSFAPGVFATLLAWRVAAQRSLSAPLRRAWFILGLSFSMFLIGQVIWAYIEVILQVEPFPSIADAFYLAFYPLALWGLLSLPSVPHNRRENLTVWLDLLSVLTAAAMFVGYFIIVPTAATGHDILTQLIAPAYPIGSLLVTGGILVVLYRRPSPNTQSALMYLLIGMLFFVSADFAFGYTSLIGTYSVGHWTDASWNVAQLFFGLAALRKVHHGATSDLRHDLSTARSKFTACLPPVAVALGYGLVFYAMIVNDGWAAQWLMAGLLLLTLLVVTRQIVSPAFTDLPIRVKMILTLLLVCALSVGLVTYFTYLNLRSNLESAVGANLKTQAETRAQTVGNLINKQVDLVESFVLLETMGEQAVVANAQYISDPATIKATLRQQNIAWISAGDNDPLVKQILTNTAAGKLHDILQIFPSQTDLLITDKYGATIAATSRPAQYYQANQEWWQAAYDKGQGNIYIGQPTYDPLTHTTNLVIAMPMRANSDSEEVVGIVRTLYNIQDISAFLSNSHRGISDDLLLSNGQLLIPTGEIVSLDPQTEARLRATANDDFTQISFQGTRQLVSQAQVTGPDEEEFQAFQKLNWILIDHKDPADALAPVNAAQRTALFTIMVVLIVTAGVAVFLAQLFVAPISRLTAVTEKIALGDFSATAQVESRDEVGILASTFNTMLATISQAQKELRESEALYRSLVDYSPDMITLHSQGKVLFMNPAGVKLLGAKSADELVGQPILDIIPVQDRESAQAGIELVEVNTQPSPLLQRKMHRLDGTSFEAEIRAIPISYAGESAVQFIMRDITERKVAEEKIRELLMEVSRQRGDLERRVVQRTKELNSLNQRLQNELIERQELMVSLRDSEERFRLLFEASPDAIFLINPIDPSWPIIDCNELACAMNGYTREEIIGQSIDILNTSPGNPAERQDYLEHIRQKGILHYEASHRHKTGRLFPVDVSTSIITVAGRELVLGIDRDITERKHAEEALNQAKDVAEESRRAAEAASRAKSEFLSRMSHELRTPMNAILGFAQLLEMSRKEALTSTQQERVKQIVKGGQHLLDLINEILDISRIEANRMQISPEPVSVRESIQEVLDLATPLAVKRHIQVVTKCGNGDVNPFVKADRQRLKQVLLNLLSNAVKYNYDGGSVIITCLATSVNKWRISITDTGPGISQENQTRLFIPFERLNEDQPNVEGTGLGLVLARRLVELMHGQLGAESTLGKGSTFWVELPTAESPVQRLQSTRVTRELSKMSSPASTILYVEDNVANFELIQQVLSDYSQMKLLWAADARTGVQMALAHAPNMILLDLHLGGTDGAEVLRQLKQNERTARIPVVVVSADATSGQAERLTALGAHEYLTKPLDVKHFVQLTEELLGEKEI